MSKAFVRVGLSGQVYPALYITAFKLKVNICWTLYPQSAYTSISRRAAARRDNAAEVVPRLTCFLAFIATMTSVAFGLFLPSDLKLFEHGH